MGEQFKCNKCNQVGSTTVARYFRQCGICTGYIHVKCFDGNVQEDKLQTSANIIYKCAACMVKYPDLREAFHTFENEHSSFEDAIHTNQNQN